MNVLRYHPDRKTTWDRFVLNSKNGTFLFLRDYMDYHSDRFEDYSLLFYDAAGKLVGLLPASLHDRMLVSHGGLTFGGVISDDRMTTPLMLEVFNALVEHMRDNSLQKIHYKAIPHIYHSIPAEEDLYAIFVYNGRLLRRDVTSAINMNTPPRLSKGRKDGLRKARKAGIEVQESSDFAAFMEIEEAVLKERYGTTPTHTKTEMCVLASRFPKNIRLFSAYLGNIMLGGMILYISTNVAHAQYMAAAEAGKQRGALDIVVQSALGTVRPNVRFFDFGISTEKGGSYLNHGLISQKEMFGARAVVHDTYELLVG